MSIAENNKNSIKVFPNPTTDSIQIQHDKKLEDWYLYNIYGQLIMKGNASSNAFNIDVTALNSGTYLLQLSNGENVFTHKILKK